MTARGNSFEIDCGKCVVNQAWNPSVFGTKLISKSSVLHSKCVILNLSTTIYLFINTMNTFESTKTKRMFRYHLVLIDFIFTNISVYFPNGTLKHRTKDYKIINLPSRKNIRIYSLCPERCSWLEVGAGTQFAIFGTTFHPRNSCNALLCERAVWLCASSPETMLVL